MRVRIWNPDELRRRAKAWNALWRVSGVALPTTRAELLLLWLETFAPGKPFAAVVVEQDDRLLAGLPLIAQKGISTKLGLCLGSLTTNFWQPSGELLLDESAGDGALPLLLEGLDQLGWPLFEFATIPSQTAAWRRFRDALLKQGGAAEISPRFEIVLVDAASDWGRQAEGWSQNHRRRVKRQEKLLNQTGEIEVAFHELHDDTASEALLDLHWEIEGRSWKGTEGGAVIKDPQLVEFYHRQRKLLASEASGADSRVWLAVLRRHGHPIASLYYWDAKGVRHLWKTAYDPEAASLSPGSLVLHAVLRRGVEQQECRLFNFMGPAQPSHYSWATRKLEVDRMLLAGRSVAGRAAVGLYRALRRLRRKPQWAPGPLCEPRPLQPSISVPAEIALCR